MNKKKAGIISAVATTIVSVIIFGNVYYLDNNKMDQTFFVDAVYFDEKKYVEITFEDKSKKSSYVVMEILGMQQSFQKEFYDYAFVEKIPFESVPHYGWGSMPVTFVVDHEDFGQITIKTEIRPNNESSAKVIFGSP